MGGGRGGRLTSGALKTIILSCQTGTGQHLVNKCYWSSRVTDTGNKGAAPRKQAVSPECGLSHLPATRPVPVSDCWSGSCTFSNTLSSSLVFGRATADAVDKVYIYLLQYTRDAYIYTFYIYAEQEPSSLSMLISVAPRPHSNHRVRFCSSLQQFLLCRQSNSKQANASGP